MIRTRMLERPFAVEGFGLCCTGEDVNWGDPMESLVVWKLEVALLVSGVLGVSVRMLYVFSVSMDEWTESADRVVNNVVEKFGIPQLQQTQLTFVVIPL